MTTPSGMDLPAAFDFHRSSLERLNRSPQTLRLYRVYQESFVAFLVEQEIHPTLDALTPQFVREWQSWLRSKSTGRRGGIVSEKQGVMTLKTSAHWLWDNDVYSFDPLARLKLPRVQKIQRKPYTQDEVVRLVQAASAGPNPIRDRAILLLLLDTGCRVGELCAASLDDVDLVDGYITFNRTKNGRPRTVRFRVQAARDGGPCMQALKNWLKVREARSGVQTLFTTRERLSLSPRRVRELFEEFGKVGRVPGAVPHRCRNTAASEFLATQPGAELALRSRLGHISHDVLADYVSQTEPGIKAAADTASLSSKWNLGGHSPAVRGFTPQPAVRRKQSAASRPGATAVDSAAIVEAVRSDPELRKALLQALLGAA